MDGSPLLKKILLIGSPGAGKTSIKQIIFPSKLNHGTIGKNIQQKCIILGNLMLHIWDSGGSYQFIQGSIHSFLSNILKNTKILVFVLDASQKQDQLKRSIQSFKSAINSLKAHHSVEIFILIHKMDKIALEKRKEIFEQAKKQIISGLFVASEPEKKVNNFFPTSIWDQTLYDAFSCIVQSVFPNLKQISVILQQICQSCSCEQGVIFESCSFLTISYFNKNSGNQIVKYERIGNLLKFFNMSCKKYGGKIEEICIQMSNFNGLLMQFTENLLIFLVYRDKKSKTAIKINVTNMRNVFQYQQNAFNQI